VLIIIAMITRMIPCAQSRPDASLWPTGRLRWCSKKETCFFVSPNPTGRLTGWLCNCITIMPETFQSIYGCKIDSVLMFCMFKTTIVVERRLIFSITTVHFVASKRECFSQIFRRLAPRIFSWQWLYLFAAQRACSRMTCIVEPTYFAFFGHFLDEKEQQWYRWNHFWRFYIYIFRYEYLNKNEIPL
jgi:hypothetical protein